MSVEYDLVTTKLKSNNYTKNKFYIGSWCLDYEMFKGFNYGEYFINLIIELTKKNAKIVEVGYVCKPRKYGQSKTSTNFIKLAKLSIPYLFLAIKSRKILYENN